MHMQAPNFIDSCEGSQVLASENNVCGQALTYECELQFECLAQSMLEGFPGS